MKIKKINEWLIDTPDGFVEFDGVAYVGEQETFKYKDLEGSKNHKVIHNGKLKSLSQVGKPTWRLGQLFDILEVKSKNHLYYSNDIISHNVNAQDTSFL